MSQGQAPVYVQTADDVYEVPVSDAMRQDARVHAGISRDDKTDDFYVVHALLEIQFPLWGRRGGDPFRPLRRFATNNWTVYQNAGN